MSALATRVVTAAILLVAVSAALFLLPPAGFGVAVLVAVTIGAREWARLLGLNTAGQVAFAAALALMGCALLLLATPAAGEGWAPPTVAIACGAATLFWLAMGIPSVLCDWQPAARWVRMLSGFVVLCGAFVAVVELQARSPWLVLAAMAIVWIADTAAFFAGRRFGRRKLAPRISPGKSWEGAAGGIAAAALYALLLVPFASRVRADAAPGAVAIALWIAFAVAVAALSIIGDLHESLLKRRAGVKDSGTLLPGHGGVLDRTDALLAAMPPVALATVAWLGRT